MIFFIVSLMRNLRMAVSRCRMKSDDSDMQVYTDWVHWTICSLKLVFMSVNWFLSGDLRKESEIDLFNDWLSVFTWRSWFTVERWFWFCSVLTWPVCVKRGRAESGSP